MPTKKPTFSVIVDDELWEAIQEYQHSNRIKSQSKAAGALMALGVKAITEQGRTPYLPTSSALQVAEAYDTAPPLIQDAVYRVLEPFMPAQKNAAQEGGEEPDEVIVRRLEAQLPDLDERLAECE